VTDVADGSGSERSGSVVTDTLVGGRYAILRSLATGGEAEVVVAHDRELDLDVVLKVYPAGDTDRLGSRRREAAMLMRVVPHPGIPLVRSDLLDGDRYYLISDYVAGQDLADRVLTGGALRLPETLAIVDQVASTLQHLHAHHPAIVHGDVKPENLVVADDGHVVIVDFGSAIRIGDDGERFGTPGYSAPELLVGEALTPAADVYSLAATTAFLLTGVVPRVGAAWPAALESIGLSRLERVIRTGLSWDPGGRHRSAIEYARRLRDAAEMDLPSGTVTAVLFDALLVDGRATAAASIVDAAGGHLVDATTATDGSAIAVFARAADAVEAAIRIAADTGAVVAVHAGDLGGWHGATVKQLADEAAMLRLRTDAGSVACSPPVRMLLGNDQRYEFEPAFDGFVVRARGVISSPSVRTDERVAEWVAARRARPLAGRAAELRLLQHVLDQGRTTGRSAIAVAVGDAGIGKTRLLAELAHRARERGDSVLVGRCTEAGAAFEPFLDALGDEALAVPVGQVERDEEGWVDRRRLFRSISDRLRTSAARHLLVLDDVQWIDGSSVALLEHLVDELHGAFAVVAASRPTPAASPLGRLPEPTVVRVGPMDVAETAALVADAELRLDDAALESLHTISGGSPFFALQLLQRIREGGDAVIDAGVLAASVREWILARVDQLGVGSRDVLAPAGVIGQRFEVLTLADVLGSTPIATLTHLDRAAADGLLTEGDHPGEFVFVHSIVSSCLAESLSAGRRALLHGAIADRIERSSDAPVAREAALHHWIEADRLGDPLHAAELAVQVAENATERLGHERARAVLDRALPLVGSTPPGPDRDRAEGRLRLAHGRAAFLAGDVDAALEQLSRAAELAERCGDGTTVAEVALVASLNRRHGRDDPELLDLLERAILVCPDEPPVLPAMLHVRRARLLPVAIDHHERSRMARQALRFVDRMDRLDRATVEIEVARGCWSPDDAVTRAEVTSRYVAQAEQEIARSGPSRWTGVLIDALGNRAAAYVQLGRLLDALADTDRAAELADAAGSTFLLSRSMTGQAMINATLGHHELAERLSADAVSLSGRHNLRLAQMAIGYQIGRDRGQQAELSLLEAALDQMVARNPLFTAGFALVHAEAGQLDDARRVLAELQAITPWTRDWLWLAANVAALEAAVLVGETGLAGDHAAVLRRYSGLWALGGAELTCFGPVDRVLGLEAMSRGDRAEAERLLTAARTSAAGQTATPWVARCDVALAQL
jgi:tRNA A-37 threonylcarbamoyl transferase component Bud32/tetratricopeptide (TPR) repeat protein